MKIAVVQMTSGLNPEKNLKKIRDFLRQAKEKNVQAVFLPEVFYSMSDGEQSTPYLVETNNEHFQNIKQLAKDFEVGLLGGSAATKVDHKIYNRVYNFSASGEELPSYDKIHLFSVKMNSSQNQGKKKLRIDESKIYTPGKKPLILSYEGFKVGMSLCFDLRFPDLFRCYAQEGANIFSISSAFTKPTGRAHWHTLLRARAIENQAYVVAAAQWGEHNDKISTYGHSLVIDPWGDVLVDAGEGEKIVFADLSLDRVREIRSRMNVL